MRKVYISQDIKKTSERLDFNGNVIDPRTKQVIVPKEADYVPPPQPTTTNTPYTETPPEPPQAPVVSPIAKDDGLSVLEQIQATKKKLAELEEAKRAKIEETEKLLKELKQ